MVGVVIPNGTHIKDQFLFHGNFGFGVDLLFNFLGHDLQVRLDSFTQGLYSIDFWISAALLDVTLHDQFQEGIVAVAVLEKGVFLANL